MLGKSNASRKIPKNNLGLIMKPRKEQKIHNGVKIH